MESTSMKTAKWEGVSGAGKQVRLEALLVPCEGELLAQAALLVGGPALVADTDQLKSPKPNALLVHVEIVDGRPFKGTGT